MGMICTDAQQIMLRCSAFVRLTRAGAARLMRQIQGQGAQMLIKLTQSGALAEITRPDRAKVISGDPVHTTWNHVELNGLYCGIWQSTAGAWRVQYDEWEYVNILSGHSVLHSADGQAVHLRAGDRCIIPQGFVGVWEVIETTTKDYVIQTFAPVVGGASSGAGSGETSGD